MFKDGLNRNILQLFMKLLPVQIFSVVTSGLSEIVNGLLVGNCLSPECMSALGLCAPLHTFFNAIASIVSGGAGILCGQYMGRGEKDKIDQVFSISVMLTFFSGCVLTAVFFLFAHPLALMLGADASLSSVTASYIRGLAFGITGHLMIPSLMSFLQMCNRSSRSLAATILLGALTTVFGLVTVYAFGGGIFAVGLSSSLAFTLTAAVMLLYFFRHKELIRFDAKKFDGSSALNLLVTGSPASLAGILYTVRNVFINQNALLIAGSEAVNALAVLGSSDCFFDSINIGVGTCITMLASVFIGERDSKSLKDLMKIAFVIGMILCMFKLSAASVLGDDAARLFGLEGTAVSLAHDLLICYSCCGFFNIVTLIFMGIYQSLERALYCNLLYPVNCIIVPLFCCLVLARIIGIRGIWLAYMYAEIVTLICMYLYASYKKKGLARNIDDMLFLDQRFDSANKYVLSIDEIEEVVDVSRQIQDFCKNNGIENRRAMLAGLCMEEMAGNIVEHGFTKDDKKHTIDVFACVEDNEVLLRLRDNCIPFDPHSRLQMHDEKDPAKNIGIRMVSKIAKQMNYQTTFGLNVLSIRL